LKEHSVASIVEIINAVQASIETMDDAKFLVRPVVRLHATTEPIEHASEVCFVAFHIPIPNNHGFQILDCAFAVLKTLNSADFANASDNFPQPYLERPPLTTAPFDLPSVLVPPEVIELDGLATDSSEDAQVKKEEWPEYYISLFDNEVLPFVTEQTYD
jgi:nuclear cap-binding protein subunit 1